MCFWSRKKHHDFIEYRSRYQWLNGLIPLLFPMLMYVIVELDMRNYENISENNAAIIW